MSTEPNVGGSGHPASHAGIPGQAGSDFFGWVRSLGIVRGPDRWAGGVASGLARRWRVNPVLVRCMFVLAAIVLGVGLLAYGILWLLLPEPDGRIHLQDAMHGRWTAGMTGSLIATVLGLGGAPALWSGQWGGGWPFWSLLWVGVALMVVYGIAASNRYPRSAPHLRAEAWQRSAADVPIEHNAPEAPAGSSPDPYRNPGWQGQPLPPHVVKPHRPSPGGAFVAVVTGIAVLVPGTLLALELAGAPSLDPSTGALWALAAGIIGLGIVVAGINGRSAGILSLFAILALVTAAIVQPVYDVSRAQTSVTSSPSSVQEAVKGYQITTGSGQLDLRALDNTGPLNSDAVVPVDATMSQLRIEIPKNIPVRVQTDATMSNVQFGSRSSSGLTTTDSQTYNDGRAGATLVLTVHATMSNVQIEQEQ